MVLFFPIDTYRRKKGVFLVLTIQVCVGSSCFIRGSYDVVKVIQDYISQHNLEATVELKGSFCLENCNQGVTVTIGENVFTRVFKEDVAALLAEFNPVINKTAK